MSVFMLELDWYWEVTGSFRRGMGFGKATCTWVYISCDIKDTIQDEGTFTCRTERGVVKESLLRCVLGLLLCFPPFRQQFLIKETSMLYTN